MLLQVGSISTAGELVRKADSQASPGTWWSRTCVVTRSPGTESTVKCEIFCAPINAAVGYRVKVPPASWHTATHQRRYMGDSSRRGWGGRTVSWGQCKSKRQSTGEERNRLLHPLAGFMFLAQGERLPLHLSELLSPRGTHVHNYSKYELRTDYGKGVPHRPR